MFLTKVTLQGFVLLHLFLEIHTRSRGDTWSTNTTTLNQCPHLVRFSRLWSELGLQEVGPEMVQIYTPNVGI